MFSIKNNISLVQLDEHNGEQVKQRIFDMLQMAGELMQSNKIVRLPIREGEHISRYHPLPKNTEIFDETEEGYLVWTGSAEGLLNYARKGEDDSKMAVTVMFFHAGQLLIAEYSWVSGKVTMFNSEFNLLSVDRFLWCAAHFINYWKDKI